MSRLLLLLMVAGVALAIVALVVAMSSGRKPGREIADARLGTVQRVSYAVLIAALFGIGAGLMGEG